MSNKHLDPTIAIHVAIGAKHVAVRGSLFRCFDDEEGMTEVPLIRRVCGSVLPADLRTGDGDRTEMTPASRLKVLHDRTVEDKVSRLPPSKVFALFREVALLSRLGVLCLDGVGAEELAQVGFVAEGRNEQAL
jgi:hypothetical protein